MNSKAIAIAAALAAVVVPLGTHALESEEKTFMMETAKGGMAEVELGELAKEKASDAKVRTFAEQIVTDHTKANAKLKEIATAANVVLPTEMAAEHRMHIEKLQKLTGSEFDQAWVDHMVKDHATDIQKFEQISKSAKDAKVKEFATNTLPTLRKHLEKAEALDKQL